MPSFSGATTGTGDVARHSGAFSVTYFVGLENFRLHASIMPPLLHEYGTVFATRACAYSCMYSSPAPPKKRKKVLAYWKRNGWVGRGGGFGGRGRARGGESGKTAIGGREGGRDMLATLAGGRALARLGCEFSTPTLWRHCPRRKNDSSPISARARGK